MFDEPALGSGTSRQAGGDGVADEPALSEPVGTRDPRDAPDMEPALSWVDSLPTYGEVYAELRAETSKIEFRSAVIISGCLSFVSGIVLIPVLAAGSVLWGPWVVVALLSAPTLTLVERRPWQISSAKVPLAVPLIAVVPTWIVAVLLGQISGVGRAAGLVFATFLTVAAAVLGAGMTNLWRAAHHDHQPPHIRPFVPYAVAAVLTVFVGHGHRNCNGCVSGSIVSPALRCSRDA